MDRSAVQAWLDRYVDAWKSYDRADIEALFAEDATYTYHPYDTGDDVVRGRDAIVQNWLDNRDEAGTYDAHYEPYAVEGDRAVAVGRSLYYSDASKPTRTQAFDNCYLLRFDGDGRCVEFTEYFMKEPDGT
ncbi:MAG TPA: nuclear transport factor 2 family protein [Candidatus Limnocylindrales bacterium]|nr:nuclear transport factor 2 family protein [Candidatus Limnocylindrales bacterium]